MVECLDRYGGLVWAMACRRCANRADAEDAVQDIFLELWRVAGRFDEARASECTFVAMIASRRLIDRQRRSGRRPAMGGLEHEPADRSPTSGSNSEIRDEARLAREMISQLRPEEQRVLKLTINDSLSHAEVAEQLAMPLGTVKSHARRGLIRLRELMHERLGVAGGGR